VLETTSPGATFTVGGTSALTTGIVRRAVSIAASGSLSYRLTLSDQPPIVLPSLSVSAASVNQPASGTANLVFTVSLTPASANPATVNYATANGTALAGTHYTATSGTLAFAVGQTSQTVSVPVSPGTLLQGASLALSLRLSTPSGASVANDTASGTINGITPAPPPPPGSALVEYVPGNSWGSGYQGTFKITNSSTATITGYELLFDFPGTTFTFFNGTLTRAGTACTFTPLSWQATIPAGTFFDNLGFQAAPGDGSAPPLSPRLRITSATGVAALQITTAALPGTSAGTAFSQTLAAGGGIGPYTWSLAPGSALPAGLTLSSTGALTGTPDAGNFSFTVRVTDLRNVSADRAFSLAVAAPPSPYTAWFASIPWAAADSSPTADPDADGLPNLLEYAFGSNPLSAASASPPSLQVSGLNLQVSFLRARADLTYEVQASSDLSSWQTIATNPGSVSASTPVTVTDTLDLSVSANPRRFLRLKITTP
jgi:chitinase